MDDSIPKVSEYKRLRAISERVAHKLVERIDKKSIDDAGEALGMMSRGTLVFSSDSEMAILLDYCIYQQRHKGQNVVERYLEEAPSDVSADEMAVLRADAEAYYSIFEALGVERGIGVYVKDLLRGDTRFLSDIGFSNTVKIGELVATRVVPHPGGILMSTGAALPMTAQQFAAMKTQLQGIVDFGSGQLTLDQETALATNVIRQALRFGYSTQVAYAEAGTPGPTGRGVPSTSRATARRAGRNDPCPCGSGRKYKVCCGRA